jgi:hypothetical protein
MTAKSGKPFEQLVAVLFGGITVAALGRTIEIGRNVVLEGKTGRHEIDVFWRLHVGNVFHDVVIQAKDWSKPVDQGEVLKFKAVLDDLPNQPRGIIVSRVGFQHGAKAIAEGSGILLFTVSPRTIKDGYRLEVTTTSITQLSVVAIPAVIAGVEPKDAAPGHDLFIKFETWFAEDSHLNFHVTQVPDDHEDIIRELTSNDHGYAGLWLVTSEGEKQRLSVVIHEYIRRAAIARAQEWSDIHRIAGQAHVETSEGRVLVWGVHAIGMSFRVRHVALHRPWMEVDKDSYIVENILARTSTVVKVPKDITLQSEH